MKRFIEGLDRGQLSNMAGQAREALATDKIDVATELALHVLAYNIKRAMAIVGVSGSIAAIRA